MRADSRTKSRVGVIVFASLLLFAIVVVVVGGKTGFFFARASYFARFPNSLGLIAGNQVRLAGVTVGAVQGVDVPEKPGEDLVVRFDIERRYQHLVRSNSGVEIKTIGLLGDRYLEVTPGSPEKDLLPSGSQIRAIRGAELDKLLAGGSDLLENVTGVAKSLRSILERVDKGQGFLGELTSDRSASGKELSRSLRQTLDTTNQLLADVRDGKGLLGRVIHDEKLSDDVSRELTGTLGSLHRILDAVEKGTGKGEGLVPALLGDPEGKARFFAMVDALKGAADGLASFSKDLAAGQGALPRLVRDEEFGKAFLGDLTRISGHLANVAKKLDSTDGTVGKLIADPSLHDAMNDIVVGIDESAPLRWLIRNRQRSGIQKRYEDERAKEAAAPTPAPAP